MSMCRSFFKYFLNACFFSSPALADCNINFSDYVGWQVVYSGYITGYIDRDGTGGDDFEGCDYDRKLILDGRYAVTCIGYKYMYSHHPRVFILSDGSQMEACIGSTLFRVRK